MLPRAQRLTTHQFDRAFANAQIVRHPLVTLRAHSRSDGEKITRAAFVVPKKHAKKATARNLIRRRLRERYRLHPLRSSDVFAGCDLIFLATPQTLGASISQLDAALEEVLGRAGKRMANNSNSREKFAVSRPLPSAEVRGEGKTRDFDSSTGKSSKLPLPPSPRTSPEVTESQPSAPINKPFLPLTFLALGLIRFYQRFISPGLPPSCRFEPSCSRYTYAAIERFGLLHGTFLGAVRICKCHPWHAGGDDPVPHVFPASCSKSRNKKQFSMRVRSPHSD